MREIEWSSVLDALGFQQFDCAQQNSEGINLLGKNKRTVSRHKNYSDLLVLPLSRGKTS
jgi:hypothetical protein